MNVDEAINYGEFIHGRVLHLAAQPRDADGVLLRLEDRLEAQTLYNLVDEHERYCRSLL